MKTPQDKDIKDRKGTQPKHYHKGLSKATKIARDRHFKKGAKMDDDNPAAYKPAPGDADAKTKPSKYTKAVKKMYGEQMKFRDHVINEDALTDKAKKSGVAAWRTGHRPGTTPQQWGHARVNAFIVKKKKGGLNHDKDLA